MYKHTSKWPVLCAVFFSVDVLASDSILFKPVVGGVATTETLQPLSTSDQWPGWCGVKIQRQVSPQTKPIIESYYTLTDGQRLSGVFELDNTRLSWRNNALQSVFIDLEQTQSIGPLHIGVSETLQKDSVLLVNNDRLDGFIESIDTTNGVALQVTTPGKIANKPPQKQLTQIPIQRIVEIRLATKVKQPTGWRFWMADGGVIDVESWSDDKNKCHLKKLHVLPETQGVNIFWNDVLAIAPNSNKITTLASCPWRAVIDPSSPGPRLSPPTIQPRIQPTAFDAIPLDLYGPGVFQFTTTQTKSTLSASLSIPTQFKSNADFQISIECAGRVLWQTKVTPEFQTTNIQIPIDGPEIIVRLDKSMRGAFGCAIRISDAIFISDTCGTPSEPNPPHSNVPTKSGL